MNAYVVSTDRRLVETMKESGHFTSVVPLTQDKVGTWLNSGELVIEAKLNMDGRHDASSSLLEGLPVPGRFAADVWLVSDRLLDIHEAISLRDSFPAGRVVYMLSNVLDPQALKTMQSLCAAHGLEYTLPYHTMVQITEAAAGLGTGKDKDLSKVITGIAALPQMGLTSSLQWLGIMLNRLSGKKIGIFGMNGWNPGDSGLSYTGKYLDELWGSLQGRQLQAHELTGKMQQLAPQVHYLAGSRDLKKLYYYNTEGAAWLIDKAKECFDLVLLDAGSYPDHALAAQSILASDLLLIQMYQRQQAKVQWQRMCEHILQPVFRWETRQSLLLFNQMHRSPEMENEKQLSRQLGLPYVGSLPFVSSFSQVEAGGKLLEQHWPEYERELYKVGKALLHFYEIPLQSAALQHTPEVREGQTRGSTWFRWMKPVRGA